MSDNSQQQEPGVGSGEQTPQPAAAAKASPNPLGSLPNPLAQAQQPPRDYEASFKGLNTRYQEDRQKWEAERVQLGEAVQQLTDRLTKLENAKPQDQPPSKKSQDGSPAADDGKTPVAPDPRDPLFERLAEMEAERNRDNTLLDMSQPGEPGAGLNLFMFRENIPAIAPDVDENGKVDNSGQRDAILSFIKKIKGTQAAANQQGMAGWTPGSSPGAPRPPTREDKLARYEEVAKQYAEMDPTTMPQAQQDAISKEYYDLISEVGSEIPGYTQPWMSTSQLATSVQTLMRRMGLVEGKLGLED